MPAISSIIELLGDEFDFFILTRDRDLHDREPYWTVQPDAWTKVGKSKVYYTADLSFLNLRRRVIEVGPDVIYLNSFFSRMSTKLLIMRRLGLIPSCPVVMAPRGELSEGALNFKKGRKWLYTTLSLRLQLYRSVLWQASSQREATQIRRVLISSGKRSGIGAETVHVTPEPTTIDSSIPNLEHVSKIPGIARFVFLARISPIKNLGQAIRELTGLTGEVSLDIYGPIEDANYWVECQQHMTRAPANLKINYCGSVPPYAVCSTLATYHFFVLPTRSENFGHVIFESLSAGCPVVISDQTPWSQVEERGAGWVVPLTNTRRWQAVLQTCVDMDEASYASMSQKASSLAQEWSQSPAIREDNLKLFLSAVSASSTS